MELSREPGRATLESLRGSVAFVSSHPPDIENLTDQQREWVRHSEALWREAHDIAATNPGVDPGDVYHAL